MRGLRSLKSGMYFTLQVRTAPVQGLSSHMLVVLRKENHSHLTEATSTEDIVLLTSNNQAGQTKAAKAEMSFFQKSPFHLGCYQKVLLPVRKGWVFSGNQAIVKSLGVAPHSSDSNLWPDVIKNKQKQQQNQLCIKTSKQKKLIMRKKKHPGLRI